MSDMRLSEDASHPAIAPLMSYVKVDKGVPLPPVKREGRAGVYGRYRQYPWAAMEAGDSFRVPFIEDPIRAQSRVISVVNYRHKRYPARFTTRILEENGERIIRVWRVA